MADYYIPEGSTKARRIALTKGGTAVPLGGATVTAELVDRAGADVTFTGTIDIVGDGSGGLIDVTDASGAFWDRDLSPYWARWRVAEAGGDAYYVPDGAGRDRIIVSHVQGTV